MAYASFAIQQQHTSATNMLLFSAAEDDVVNQSFSTLLTVADSQSSAENALDGTSALPALDMQNFPLEQLLQSEWFHQNISQMLNISMDNLTSLLINNPAYNNNNRYAQRDPMTLVATLTIFYAFIFIAGVLGNLITCIVISRNRFMHTATNYYLFNLAVSDLILLMSGMPQDLYNLWCPDSYPFTDVLCVLESVLSETAANATVLTITAFTVERYIAICHPFRQHTMSKLSRAIKFIFAIWVTAFLLALPQAMQFSVVAQNGGKLCTMKNDFVAHVFAVSGFIFFGGPMTAICVLYVLIGVKLKRSRLLQAVPRRCYDVNRGISAQSRVIRMLVAVAVAFFLCWAPFHAQRLMAVYGSTSGINSEIFNEIFHILDFTSGVLYFLSTCINPLLYNIMSHKFREAFKVTLARQFRLGGMYQTQNHNYSALLRQNGSMRLHTTVNNNALEQFSSYRVVQLQCRDPSHHLSLQDSIRTTTTTTTVNSASGGGGNNSCRSSHRNRCISVGSQSTLMTSFGGKNDVYMPMNSAAAAAAGSTSTSAQQQPGRSTNGTTSINANDSLQHRILQTQISQLSSVGDANSLLEECQPYAAANTSYRLKELRRSLAAAKQQTTHKTSSLKLRTQAPSLQDDCLSIDSREWDGNTTDLSRRCSDQTEADLLQQQHAKPVAPPLHITPMNSIAELTCTQPTRSRLKLSRIISRRDQDAVVAQASPRVELMRAHLPGMGHIPLAANDSRHAQQLHGKAKITRAQPRKANSKTLEGLAAKFRWRKRRKLLTRNELLASAENAGKQSSRRVRQESSSSTSSSGTPTAHTALMAGSACAPKIVPSSTTVVPTTATITGDILVDSSAHNKRNGNGSLKYDSSRIL